MSKLPYWERRKALMVDQMAKAESFADELEIAYQQTMRYLQGQTDKIFDKFRRDYGLTEQQARQILKQGGQLDNLNDLKQVLAAQPDDPNITQLLADLDSPAYAFRIERLHRLQKEMQEAVRNIAIQEQEQSRDFYGELADDSFHRSTFELQQRSGLGYSFNSPSEAEISSLLRSRWEGGSFSSRIWNNTQSLSQGLKTELLVSLLSGRSDRETAEAIAKRFEAGKYNSRRLVRTESAFFHGQMELKSYEEADVEWYRFVAVLDLRTSSKCQHQDGKTHKVSEAVTGVTYPPLHPWCRSTTIASDDKEWLSKLERRARAPETGKNILVPGDMTYKEWYGRYVEKKSLEIADDKVYNQDMNNLDLMAKQRSFTIGNDIRVSVKKISGTDFDFWAQDNTKKIRNTQANVQEVFQSLTAYNKPTVVFLKKSRLPGFAGYDYKQDILFVSDMLHSESEFSEILSDNFFAAKNIKDTIIHELTHKKHWDSAKAFYKANKKRYNSVEEAMSALNAPLVSYVKEQIKQDYNYLYRISDNAAVAFYRGNINELVAEVGVLGDGVQDKELYKKVQEVLSWK